MIQMRVNVPVDEEHVRVWTFSPSIKAKGWFAQVRQDLSYYLTKKPGIIIGLNEQEDLTVFMKDRLNFALPQKLGPLDTGVIYFRRHLARRARDWQRLGHAQGALKELTPREREEEAASLEVGVAGGD